MSDNATRLIGCPEAAAVELMRVIAEHERSVKLKESLADPRGYWLNLYGECLAAVRGPS